MRKYKKPLLSHDVWNWVQKYALISVYLSTTRRSKERDAQLEAQELHDFFSKPTVKCPAPFVQLHDRESKTWSVCEYAMVTAADLA